MVKLKLNYKIKSSKPFVIFGIIIGIAVLAESIYYLWNKNWISGIFSFIFSIVVFWVANRATKEEMKQQIVEVESYEELKD